MVEISYWSVYTKEQSYIVNAHPCLVLTNFTDLTLRTVL